MIFTSYQFAIFFLLALVSYWAIGTTRLRHIFLLIASFWFYAAWDWRFLALLAAVIMVAWAGPKLFDRYPDRKKLILTLSIVALLCLLGTFKYFNFFTDSFVDILNVIGFNAAYSTLNIILPVGISFYIFQAVSYLVDAYREEISRQTDFLKVALYISFFPQLVAGPIVRAHDFIPQLEEKKRFSEYDFLTGLKLFVIGLIYKAVFADHLAGYVDPVFADLAGYDNASIRAATFAFYGQIYFDFAGYSTMAIGCARMLGFALPRNFDFPYASRDIADFWRRWHISLSGWLRDYVYIPMGGNRGSKLQTNQNLMKTMLLGGLWHGASWNFVLWGFLHGAALIVHRLWDQSFSSGNSKAGKWRVWGIAFAAWLLTQAFVAACWVPFRAENAADTQLVFNALLALRNDSGLASLEIPLVLLVMPLLVDTFIISGASGRLKSIRYGRLITYALIGTALAIAVAAMKLDASPFIYFQF
ncbi:MBOAT family protein [Parvularcula sp. IMCC14364]|uniref:MBOAT family O-acyltransferase n=1 Tax=Parvularcula sp. IMCC14364 TaxID=3067902 RepID=UPI002740546F|nr:MBOAT family O-acyltransferase [Parvularcula sp. IMCC14364]